MEREWMAPQGISLSASAPRSPIYVAISLGFALRGQLLTVNANPAERPRFNRLLAEAQSFLSRVAASANGWDATQQQPVNGPRLWEIAEGAMNGVYDSAALQNFGRAPGPAPSVLAYVDQPAYPARPPANRPLEPRSNDGNAINLLGQDPDRVLRRNDPPPQADRVLGPWNNSLSNDLAKAAISVSKQNGRYVVLGNTKYGSQIGGVLRYDATTGDLKGTFMIHFRREQLLEKGGWVKGDERVVFYEYCEPASGRLTSAYKNYGKRESLGFQHSNAYSYCR